MKLRRVIINILPFPIWLIYYLLTMSGNGLFLTPINEDILLLVIIGFTIYNFSSHKISDFLIGNFIMIISLVGSCFIGGQMYLKYCPHMSDEHNAVKSIPFDIAIWAVAFTLFVCLIKVLFRRIKKEIGDKKL